MGRRFERTFVIAEMACSHDGEPAHARALIDCAGDAGADAIQFQVWLADDLMVPYHSEFERHRALQLERDEWTALYEYTRSRYPELQIIACVYENASVEFCEALGVDAYKVHSSDLSNRVLLDAVARTGKRIDLSVGASTLTEIQDAIARVSERSAADIWLMYGLQNFPTPPSAVHLDYLAKLGPLFELPIGYQDHSDPETDASLWIPAAAQGMGVDILEKHLTHDRDLKGVDHEAALNPDEFVRFVAMVRQIDEARGDSRPKPFTTDEHTYRRYAKKRMVASRSLKAGTVIEDDHIRFMRAEAFTLTPDKLDLVVGQRLRRDLDRFEPFLLEDVE